ncbi:MAG: zinc-binding dehydrogenase [Verrucomicrobium sp.]|nr:zinc-binding dehydrogenase [Verrucomicrobium sp.]
MPRWPWPTPPRWPPCRTRWPRPTPPRFPRRASPPTRPFSTASAPGAGQSILIHGGSGGVGGFALQLARELRLRVLATASPANLTLVQELGADTAIDYTGGEAAIAEAVRHATQGLGVDVVLDAAGPPRATEAFDLLAFGGALVCVAGLPDFSKWKPFHKACSVHEISLGAAYGPGGSPAARAELGRLGASVIGRLAAGRISSLVTEVVPFEEIPQALGRLQRREVTGKIVARGPGF